VPEPLPGFPLGNTETQPPSAPDPSKPTPVYTYHVVNTYLHDPTAFTQGLVYTDDILYEGTGLNGASTVRKVDLTTGQVIAKRSLPSTYFGEGIAVLNGKIYQLTWQSGTCFVYDKNTLDPIKQFSYSTEGWGLTHDGKQLIMSDGTSTLYFRDPETFSEICRIEVIGDAGPVRNLNELEYIDGEIYANIWQTDRIARINPKTGKVTAWIDLSDLLSPEDRFNRVDVLNGIAYDASAKRLFVTGKWWPKLFEINLIPKS
jgi:glutamine cyclotransferase